MRFLIDEPTRKLFTADLGGGAGATTEADPEQSQDPGADPENAEQQPQDLGTLSEEQIQALFETDHFKKAIQSETDRVRTEYVKKLKAKESELEELRTAKMTEEQKREYEISKREKEIREKQDLLTRREVEIAATNALVEKEIPLSFRDFVLGETPEETAEKVDSLSKLWKSAIDAEVQKRFAEKGRVPGRSHETLPEGTNMNDLIRRAVRR